MPTNYFIFFFFSQTVNVANSYYFDQFFIYKFIKKKIHLQITNYTSVVYNSTIFLFFLENDPLQVIL